MEQEERPVQPDLYSVEQVAKRLGLHVRTVRNYIRDGRLKAVRIGKQYRISREDLEALTGSAAGEPPADPVRRRRYVDASSVVQIDAVSPDDAGRITNGVIGAANAHRQGDVPLRVEAVYDEQHGRLKIIVTGSLSTTAGILQLVALYLE